MLDINLDFNGIFSGIFNFKKKKKRQTNFNDFFNSLSGKSNESRINMIIEKMVNSKNDVGLLYKVENNANHLITFYGEYNINKNNNLNLKSIPIFLNGKLDYILVIGIYTKKLVNLDDNLLELLKNNLS